MPGPAVALALDPAKAQAEHLAVSNTADARARLLLQAAALQAQDAHGNAAAAPGLRVRLALRWSDGQPGGVWSFLLPLPLLQFCASQRTSVPCMHWKANACSGAGGSELPVLETEGSSGSACKTDERGRAYFGDVRIAQGSGRVGTADENAPGNAPGTLELVLVAEVAGLAGADARCGCWTKSASLVKVSAPGSMACTVCCDKGLPACVLWPRKSACAGP